VNIRLFSKLLLRQAESFAMFAYRLPEDFADLAFGDLLQSVRLLPRYRLVVERR